MRRLVLAGLLGLAACGPIPLTRAEDQCVEEARLAKSPRGEIGVGVGSGGGRAVGEITISSDFLLGKDPVAVYDSCVVRRSGQMPSRPLLSHPAWR
jgi:hypothetical protein